MDILFGAEIARDWNAVEVAQSLDDTRILDGPNVEKQHERREQDGGESKRYTDEHQLASPVVHTDRDER